MKPFLLLLLAIPSLLLAEEKEKPALMAPKSVTTEHSVTIDGQEVEYQATAATLILKDDKNKPRASVFHVSYVRTNPINDRPRPVVFCFNGGPGSSAVWLHLGGIGPRLVPTTEDGRETLPPPQVVVPNPFSILDIADLVFIDPVSTGYSRPGEKNAREFHGVDEDINSVGDFIRRWVTIEERWSSPKFLLGESYGGIRAAGLAEHLQNRYGMNLNGVILLSSLLDYRTLQSGVGDDLQHQVFLPGLTATAHFHGKIKGDRDQLLAEAHEFATEEYPVLLLKGNQLPQDQKAAAAQRLAKLTGLTPELWEENHLRVSSSRFRKELLRDQNLVLGRFDARVSWPAASTTDDFPHYDPSYEVVYGAFSTAMLDYLTRDLDWQEDSPYEILTGRVHPWNWGATNSHVNLSDRLQTAMVKNPDLRLLILCGHTDLATPPAAVKHSIDHFFKLPPERRDQIEFQWYEAGHMFYLNQPDLEKMRRDLVSFIVPKN